MAITEAFAGSETVSTTEWSLTTDTAGPDVETSDGFFQPFLDLNALAAGDEFVFKIYEKAQAADTQRLVHQAYFNGPQYMPIYVGPALMLMHGWDMTLDKLAGTDRAITWSIRKGATPTEAFAGSETVSTTEWSLTTDTAGPDVETSDGIFQCFVDLNVLAAGDLFKFQAYEKVQSADTQRVVFTRELSTMSPPIFVSPALTLMHGWDFTLDKIAGTDRAITWSIRKVT